MPALTADEVIRVLLDNGFVLDHQRGSHRVYYSATTGKRVVVPYHRRDLPKGTLLAILKQAGLSRDDL
ncbi:MAG: type II toxin-antitoxin system HicA family toxin [Chloroflexi bacterium]|nr:type II toxin-antitoxin system HicA family toxin [Chloroflexota bacterium]